MATIKDVAQSAQVSATTVSRVLNRDDNMSVTPEVRMRWAMFLPVSAGLRRKRQSSSSAWLIGASSGRTGPTSAFLLCRAWCR